LQRIECRVDLRGLGPPIDPIEHFGYAVVSVVAELATQNARVELAARHTQTLSEPVRGLKYGVRDGHGSLDEPSITIVILTVSAGSASAAGTDAGRRAFNACVRPSRRFVAIARHREVVPEERPEDEVQEACTLVAYSGKLRVRL